MPSISNTGRIAAGSGVIGIDRHVIAQGAGGTGLVRWVDDDTVIYQDVNDKVVQHNVTTDSIEQRETYGANEIAAGGGQSATWLAGVGLRHSRGGLMPNAGLEDVGRDGTLAICPNRQTGIGLNFIALQDDDATRRFMNFETVVAQEVHVVRWGCAVWKNERGEAVALIDGRQIPVPAIAPVFHVRLLSIDGEWWVAYNTNEEPRGRTLFHPITVTEGYVIADGDAQFGLDVFALDNDRVLFTWAGSEGEDPAAGITVAEFNLKSHRLTGAGDDRILAYEKLTRRTNAPIPPKEPTVPDELKYPFPDGYNPVGALEVNRATFRTPIYKEGEYDDRAAHLISACRIIGYGAGLLRKNGGTHTTLPNGVNVSQDWLEFENGTALDFLGDGEDKATIQWGVPNPSQGERIDVSEFFGQGVPVVDPPKSVKWPANGNAIVAAAMTTFPGFSKGTDTAKRAITFAIAQQFAVIDPAFGAKKADPTRDHSKNAIGYNVNPLVGFVLFTDAGDPILNPAATPMSGQVFVPVTPDNWMGLGIDPPTPPVPPVQPDSGIEARLAAIEAAIPVLNRNDQVLSADAQTTTARIAELKAAVAQLQAEVAALKAGVPVPAPTPTSGNATEATLKEILALLKGLAGKLPLAA